MTIKEILTRFIMEKDIKPPFTRKKIEKKGYNVTDFLLDLKNRLEKASDLKESNTSAMAFLNACEKLM